MWRRTENVRSLHRAVHSSSVVQARQFSATAPVHMRQPIQHPRERLIMDLGFKSQYLDIDMGSDWEFADGTPHPKTASHNHVDKNLRAYMEGVIEACATIEEMAEENQLPTRPGTDTIRRFDPQVPLFLPIDDIIIDRTTPKEQKLEVYQDMAPYHAEAEKAKQMAAQKEETAGDGTPLSNQSDAKAMSGERSTKKRRRKVTQVKQHWRFRMPYDKQVGPFRPDDDVSFNSGHGTGAG